MPESDTTNTNSTTAVGHEYPLFTVTASQTPPIVIPVKINDKQIQMELDTRAAVSLVSEGTYKLHWPEQQLQQSSDKLKMYSGEYLDILGSAAVTVEYGTSNVTIGSCKRWQVCLVETG